MFKNSWKIAWRNLVKDGRFTLLNLAGLSIGLTAVFLIFLGTGPVNAATLNAVPSNLRATAMAGQLLAIHLFGDGILIVVAAGCYCTAIRAA